MRFSTLLLLFVTIILFAGCGGNGESEADRMAEEHEGETPSATEAARAPASPVTTETVSYTKTEDGTTVTGYMAMPANADSLLRARGLDPASAQLPGLVVIHEWWGLNDNIRTTSRRLAGEGYRVLAVDLYRGATATTSDSAQALMKRATARPKQMMSNLNAAHTHLRSETNASRVGIMGWCFGGSRTFEAVAAAPTRYDAAVAYYGSPEPMTASVLQKLSTPVLAHFGRKDQAISMESVRAFQSRLEKVDAPATVHVYDAGHAFANPSGESYVPKAAEQAWSRTTNFFAQNLYP